MKKEYFWIAFLIFVIVYIIVAQNFGSKRTIRRFEYFYTTNISGVLEYARAGSYGSVFKVQGIENEFVFYPNTGKLNRKKIFYHIAKKGDLIYKPAYSDTLKLIKNGKIYLYTFKKFD